MPEGRKSKGDELSYEEEVRLIVRQFQGYFEGNSDLAGKINGSISEAMDSLYGPVVPEANEVRERAIELLNDSPDEEGYIEGEIQRNESRYLVASELKLSDLEKQKLSSEAPLDKQVWRVNLIRYTDKTYGTRDELRMYNLKPGYVVDQVVKDDESVEFKNIYNRPVVIHADGIAVWLGDPSDKNRKAKVNVGSESYPKVSTDIVPDSRAVLRNEIAQRFIDKYEEEIGQLDLDAFADLIEKTGLEKYVAMSTKMEAFLKTAMLYAALVNKDKIDYIDPYIGYAFGDVSQRDLRGPEALQTKIALQILEKGHDSSRFSEETFFESHLELHENPIPKIQTSNN